MKKILAFVAVLLIVLMAVMLFNTATFKSKQIADKQPRAHNLMVDSLAIQHLSGAIRIQTISYDDSTKMKNTTAFDTMLEYLKSTYPAVFSRLQDTVINNRNLLLKWAGSDSSLQPAILYAHMDVVPIESATINQWTHGPFSGDIAAGAIWGRGAIDDKGSLISILEAFNRLVQNDFKPKRTIYLASGSDEEIGGNNGAKTIADYCRVNHIHFKFYLDEGLMVSEGMVPGIDKDVALIGTAEKGYVTFNLSVNMKGGHSSSPPKETCVDVLANAIKQIHDHPFKKRATTPVNEFISYLGPQMPLVNKIVFANAWLLKPLILSVYEKTPEGNAMIRTTGVTTIVDAGIKENVIPSYASAKVNFRILPGESAAQVEKHVRKIINDPRVTITTGELFEPSKIGTANAWGFKLLQHTSAEIFPDACVAPFLMIGGTDSKHFEDLSDEIYRFFPTRMDHEALSGFHGINEKIKISGFMETISFYQQLIQDMQDFKGENQK
jgi:carboxypeptidase PM20D1